MARRKLPSKVTRFEKPELVYIEVQDHASIMNDKFEEATKDWRVMAVGWLIAEDDKKLYVMMSANFEDGTSPFESQQMDVFVALKADIVKQKKVRVSK